LSESRDTDLSDIRSLNLKIKDEKLVSLSYVENLLDL